MVRFGFLRQSRSPTSFLTVDLGPSYPVDDAPSSHIKVIQVDCNSWVWDISDITRKLCKVIMSSPTLALDTALNQTGIRVSPYIVENVLKRFENAGMLAYRFFEWAGKQQNYSHSVRAYHTVIESLAKIRQYQIMWDLVNAMKKKEMLNVETFCIMMRKYARVQKSKNVRKAQEIFDRFKDQFVPDSKTYSILVGGWGKAPNLPKAREIFREMVDMGCNPDIVTYGIMVDILCKAGRVDEAVEVVKDMDANNCRPTSFIYSVLVHTYGVELRIEDAIDSFLEMERNGIKADIVVYNALISAFCKVNKFKNVYRVLNEMECKGITPNSRTYNIIISSLVDNDRSDEAYSAFRRMIKSCEPDADTYTMMIKMFCERNDLKRAMKIWRYMKLKRFVPSMHTFSVLINGLCGKGKVTKACVLLEDMIEKGIRPSGVTFGKLRQLLIKEGREDVLKFLQEKMNLLVKEPLYD
ncbi:hypothetical protein K1719_044426 [Acacia pycnantha]|nr:hypothetical protein K1719_044426 [Acacia pycnantha]